MTTTLKLDHDPRPFYFRERKSPRSHVAELVTVERLFVLPKKTKAGAERRCEGGRMGERAARPLVGPFVWGVT